MPAALGATVMAEVININERLADIIDINERLAMDKAQKGYAELVRLLNSHKAAVLADPQPYLDAVTKRMVHYDRMLMALYEALFPVPDFNADPFPVEYKSIGAEALERLNAVQSIVRHFIFNGPDEGMKPDGTEWKKEP